MIEPEIAALAAQKATEEEIARMQALCDAIEEKVRRNENYGALDQQLDVYKRQQPLQTNLLF